MASCQDLGHWWSFNPSTGRQRLAVSQWNSAPLLSSMCLSCQSQVWTSLPLLAHWLALLELESSWLTTLSSHQVSLDHLMESSHLNLPVRWWGTGSRSFLGASSVASRISSTPSWSFYRYLCHTAGLWKRGQAHTHIWVYFGADLPPRSRVELLRTYWSHLFYS